MGPLSALLAGWVVTALWPIVGQDGVRLYSPALFAQAGLAVGFASLLPWLLRAGRWRSLFAPGTRGGFMRIGLLGSALPSFLFFAALEYTTPANAAIMAQAEVLYSWLLCAWLLKERVTASQAAGSLLVLAGTGLILLRDLSTPRWKGDLIMLLTPWMFQLAHIQAKRLPAGLEAPALAAGRLFYGSLALLPLSLWTLRGGPRWSWSAEGLALVGLQGGAMYALSHVLWYSAIRRMELAKATGIMLSYPALTLLFSWALGREALQAAQLAGLALTFGGAYWLSSMVRGAGPAEMAA